MPTPGRAPRPWHLPAALLGAVLGVALQLQQPALWPRAAYAALLGVSLLAGGWLAWRIWRARMRAARRWHGGGLLLIAAALLYGLCGLRAAAFLVDALAPQLEGRDLQLTGVVAAMPQSRETGLRLRLAVESARLDGAPVRVPGLIDLSWYASAPGDAAQAVAQDEARPLPAVHAGERWT